MKRVSQLLVILALCLLLAPAASADTWEEHLNQGNALYKAKDLDGAVAEFIKAVELLKKAGNSPGAQQIQMNVGIILFQQEKYEEAVKALEEAKAINKKPDQDVDVKLNKILATAHHLLGRYATRAEILEGLLAKYKKLDPAVKVDILAELADAYRRSELYSKAIPRYQEALKLTTAQDPKRRALLLTALAQTQYKLGSLEAARQSLLDALVLSKTIEEPQNLAEVNSNLGIINWEQSNYPTAFEYITTAKEVETGAGLKRNLGSDFNNEGLVYKAVGDYPKALASIEKALEIFREIGDEREEALALSNRGLLYRILGRNDEAMADYTAALKIYERISAQEYQAGAYLGLGKLYEVDKQDFRTALEYYRKAEDIFRRLGSVSALAEALNQIGRVLKKGIDPERTNRDLVFSMNDPVFIDLPPEEALKQSMAAYREALELAQKAGRREAIWSAEQGLGYALAAEGREKEALKYYQSAINTVMNIYGREDQSSEDRKLMGDYLKDKEDLFTEAIDLASRLYNKTKDKEYLRLMMEFQEIYKNEVMKTALEAANLTYQDEDQARLLQEIRKTLAEKNRVEAEWTARMKEAGVAEAETGADKAEAAKRRQGMAEEAKYIKYLARELETTVDKLLAQWKKRYPSEAGLFDTSSKMNLEALQKILADDEALIQYFPLPDRLNIICLTKEEIVSAEASVTYRDLSEMIRDDLLHRQIERFGHDKCPSEEACFNEINQLLNRLYTILIKPVESVIKDKPRLVIIPSKYLSYVPFAALVKEFGSDGEPHYLVRDKIISYIRLSFFKNTAAAKKREPVLQGAKVIAVGDPVHDILQMSDLPGTLKEVDNISKVADEKQLPAPDSMVRTAATEDAWKGMVVQQPYNVFYFATHSVPYAEALSNQKKAENAIPKWEAELEEAEKSGDQAKAEELRQRIKRWKGYVEFCRQVFQTKSPLYGFLYLSYSGKETEDGVLTLKEIMEMPDDVFKNARLAVLSACNTAVTYSPAVSRELRRELEATDAVSQELAKAGWTPGVDQICLSDTFMKKNLTSVLGTLWFAEDVSAAFITSRFFERLDKMTAAEALQQAQLDYLKDPPLSPAATKTPRHPFFWAVGIVFGQ